MLHTPYSSTKETPYRLMCGLDAMIPIELTVPSLRIMTMNEEFNELARIAEFDLVEEEKEKASVKGEAIKQQIVRKHNKKVNLQEFEEGDLVLRKLKSQRKPQGKVKLAPNWEAPYRIT